ALIVGTATYGKGSAQHVFRLENGAVKLTTALWYTPSGRSINRPRAAVSDDGSDDVPPDTTKPRPKFRTDAGRAVMGGGGIVPDVEVPNRLATPADRARQTSLGAKVPQFRDAIVEYALSLKASHAIERPDFEVTPAMRAELFRRLTARGVSIPRSVYDSAAPLVTRALGSQVTRYLFGARAEFVRGLNEDAALAKAKQLLRGVQTQKALLERPEK
ncbi:MAG: carboxyl-terminal protease, partial [Gemmatimonadetes bacterium]|nr:carboxyl-terminal protease [Gemmatimonadota bacterium]